MIGFSWGAWLSYIVAASYPTLVRKLILVGSGPYEHSYAESIQATRLSRPYEHSYAESIQATRLSRLSEGERAEHESIIETLNDPAAEGKPAAFDRLGALASKTDAYDPVTSECDESESVGDRPGAFHGVLEEAVEMRRSGKLLDLAQRIQCPVVAIHGDYDPHPAEGVQVTLSAILESFRLILLRHCGHKPWVERQARDEFYRVLREELL